MNGPEEGASALGSGPVLWLVTIGITTLLLVASTKALWLVVPFLVAIILYYLLYPIVRRLVLAGIGREAAAALVAGAVTLGAVGIMIPLVPWLVAQSGAGEETLFRYLDGGRALVERTLAGLESQFAFLRRLDFHAEVGRRAAVFGETAVSQYLGDVLLGAAVWLPSLLLAPFFAFFLLRDGHVFMKLLARGIPNAFFERAIHLFDRVDATARSYFQGLLLLTAFDTVCLALGLWLIGIPGAALLGFASAVLCWIPVVGPVLGGILVVLVAATEMPAEPSIVYATIVVFVLVRLLDDFFLIPYTIGRMIRMHPLPTVLMIFIGGAVAGVAGLILALPLAAVVSAVVTTLAGIVNDPRLRARHAFAKALRARRINADLRL